jgi:TrmH family RNA methyltransferase
VKAALESDWEIERIVVVADAAGQFDGIDLSRLPHAILPHKEYLKLTDSETPQGVLAIVRAQNLCENTARRVKTAKRIVVADNVADPGNLGTMIRTAAAFGYDLFICFGECAEVYNPKTLRATQGALFVMPMAEITTAEQFLDLCGSRFKIVTFSGDGQTPLTEVNPPERMALVFGSEIRGISKELAEKADMRLRIEQTGRIDSLNVAIAAGVGMYWGRGRDSA